eukprot:TRINITY_DN7001_c0_g1_i5.p1 TRINITY_DN7001_c0_g1~~TRINITY_DN7001_c0_g1_i5.p1  ORF type:complete len:425 (+),score=84.30 TRINITY_DN7001_c0_g1_i5:56-1330(+)
MDANTNTATLSSMPSDANANRPKSPETQRFELKPTQELRFQVAVSEAATLKLVSGNAEIFGTEIVSGKVYEFSQTKLAVFTWHGCILELSGKYTSAYVGEETPMDYYINIHHGLHKLRLQAAQEKRSGPRVMLVGPTDSGKSSVSRILINYAIRHDMRPTYVDLDVGQNSISPPGCVAAIPMFRPVDVEEGYSLLAPLAFFYGHENLSANPTNFKHQTLQLAKALSLQADKDPVIKASGLVINTAGWVEGLGYGLIISIAEAMNVTHILAFDDEKLRSDLNGDPVIQRNRITVVHLPKSGGVVKRDQEYRRATRKNKTHEYFYGIRGDLHPNTRQIKFDSVKIYRIGPDPRLPKSALPLGVSLQDESLKPNLVPISRSDHTRPFLSFHSSSSVCIHPRTKSLCYTGSLYTLYWQSCMPRARMNC